MTPRDAAYRYANLLDQVRQDKCMGTHGRIGQGQMRITKGGGSCNCTRAGYTYRINVRAPAKALPHLDLIGQTPIGIGTFWVTLQSYLAGAPVRPEALESHAGLDCLIQLHGIDPKQQALDIPEIHSFLSGDDAPHQYPEHWIDTVLLARSVKARCNSVLTTQAASSSRIIGGAAIGLVCIGVGKSYDAQARITPTDIEIYDHTLSPYATVVTTDRAAAIQAATEIIHRLTTLAKKTRERP